MSRAIVPVRAAAIAFVVAAVVVAIMALGQRIALGGPDSLGTRAGWFAGAAAGLSFAVAFMTEGGRSDRPELAWRNRVPAAKRIVDLVVLTAAVGLAAYLIVIAVAQVFQLGFRGLTVDPLGGGALAGFAAAALAYVGALYGARTSGPRIAALAVSLLFMGTLASMVTSPDESWWQLHFSQLGNTAGVTGYRFNLALIMTGLLLTVLAGFVGHSVELGLARRGAPDAGASVALSWLFAAIGLCMVTAGAVPDAVNVVVHVGAASGIVVFFGAVVFVSLSRVPGLPKDLVGFTIVVVAGIVVSVLLWVPIDYYSLTGTELVAAGLLFAWLLVFVRAAETYAGEPVRASIDAEHR